MPRIVPIDLAPKDAAIVAFFRHATDLPVVWARQDAPRPALPYLVLERLTGLALAGGVSTAKGWKTTNGTPNAEGSVTVRRSVTASFTLNAQVFTGPATGTNDAMGYMASILSALESPEALAILDAQGLVAINFNPPIDLSAVSTTRFETRASIDLDMHTTMSFDTVTDSIATVGICSEILEDEICFTVESE